MSAMFNHGPAQIHTKMRKCERMKAAAINRRTQTLPRLAVTDYFTFNSR